jgi:periplasmic copper chaperone A
MRFTILVLAALLWGCAPEPDAPDAPPPAPEAPPAAAGPLVSDAWVRPVPPTARMTAGYLDVFNPGPEELVIVGAESPLFGSIEIHGTFLEDGVARMRHLDAVTVPAGEVARFAPGGLHLMLMQPLDEIPSSGHIELSLVLDDGERLEFTAQVGRPGG